MINSWVDRKWIGIISGGLHRFKWVGNDTANFRCPYCGDSQKSSLKARGYLYKQDEKYFYNCKNCGISKSLQNFIKEQFPTRYIEYKLEITDVNGANVLAPAPINKNTDEKSGVLNEIVAVERVVHYDQSIDILPDDHPAKIYCRSRMIPEHSFDRILYTDNFQDWVVNVLQAEKYKDGRLPDDQRLLLPLRKQNGNLFGVQGRSLEKNSKSRYITIKKNDFDPKIFGLDRIDVNKPIFAVEGPIDSLFLPNCVAFCGGDVNIHIDDIDPASVYILLDNERRSYDTAARMQKAIDKGYNVMFWAVDSRYKDINDMVKNGNFTTKDILKMVKQNSFRGLRAQLELAKWSINKERKYGRRTKNPYAEIHR